MNIFYSPSARALLFYSVKYILYIAILVLIAVSFYKSIVATFESLKKRVIIFGRGNKRRNEIYTHIDKIMFSLTGKRNSGHTSAFITATIVLWIVLLVFVTKSSNIVSGAIIATLVASVPYIVARMLLHKVRISSSYDAEKVIAEILNQYKVHNLIIKDAIRSSLKYLRECPYTYRQLTILAINLDSYKSEDELDEIFEYFNFSIGTQWALMFTTNVKLSIVSNINITSGLADILSEIGKTTKVYEESKRENHESRMMAYFLAPILYILSPLGAKQLMGFPISKFFRYQFSTKIGITLFIGIVTLYIVNTAILYFIKNKKFDI